MSRGSRKPSTDQVDLFGGPPAAQPKDQTLVELPLQLCGQTEQAWLLRAPGGDAKWSPKALVKALEDRAGVYRMPRWIALERGWG